MRRLQRWTLSDGRKRRAFSVMSVAAVYPFFWCHVEAVPAGWCLENTRQPQKACSYRSDHRHSGRWGGDRCLKSQDTLHILPVSIGRARNCTFSNFSLIFLCLCLAEALLGVCFQTAAALPVLSCRLFAFHAALLPVDLSSWWCFAREDNSPANTRGQVIIFCSAGVDIIGVLN